MHRWKVIGSTCEKSSGGQMGIPAPTELLLILAIVIMVFGTKRIPEIMTSVAQGIKSFKKGLETEETPPPPLDSEKASHNQISTSSKPKD
jgi:TatA/E family protein of Tat protein translocase